MTIIVAEAPNGQARIIRAEAIVSLSAPFAWSQTVQARTLHLSTGQNIFILDTPGNLGAIQTALNPEGASVRVVAPLNIIVTQPIPGAEDL